MTHVDPNIYHASPPRGLTRVPQPRTRKEKIKSISNFWVACVTMYVCTELLTLLNYFQEMNSTNPRFEGSHRGAPGWGQADRKGSEFPATDKFGTKVPLHRYSWEKRRPDLGQKTPLCATIPHWSSISVKFEYSRLSQAPRSLRLLSVGVISSFMIVPSGTPLVWRTVGVGHSCRGTWMTMSGRRYCGTVRESGEIDPQTFG